MKVIEGKCILLGSQGVGKTSLVTRFIHDRESLKESVTYKPPGNSTIGACYFKCSINLPEAKVKVHVWDTAGQEKFRCMARMYYRQATSAILVFDIAQYKTFLDMQTWVGELKSNIDEAMVLIIVGNKIDLAHERQVDSEECERYAESIGASYYEISALHNEGVDRVFSSVALGLVRLGLGDTDIVTSIKVFDSEKTGMNYSNLPLHEDSWTNTSIAHGEVKKPYFCC